MGWFDTAWRSSSGEVPEVRRENDSLSLEAPGVMVRADPAAVGLGVAGSVVVFCRGQPSVPSAFGDRGAAQAIAEMWASAQRGVLRSIHGRYGLVILDLARGTAALVTDRFAVHPICYAIEGTRIAFSERADGLPTRAAREVDLQAIFDYFYFHVIPAPRTIFRGVQRLDGASVATFSRDGLRVERHWQPRFSGGAKAATPELKEEFRRLVRNAVERELSDRSAGCFLSGGTDSSTVAGMLGEVTKAPPQAFSIGFDAQGYDESAFARMAARHFGAKHHEYYLTRDDLLASMPVIATRYDQPFGNSSAVAAYQCEKLALEAGVEKLLAGDGGDELFGGNTRYAKQKVFEAYQCLPGVVRQKMIEPLLQGIPKGPRIPGLKKVISYVDQARIPLPDRLELYNLLIRLGREAVFEPSFLAGVDTDAPTSSQRAFWAELPAAGLVDRMLAYDWKYTLADNDLPKVVGTAGMAGIDVGFPLLDDDLLDFSLTLGPELKVRGLRLRYFFKEALRGFLPEAIIAKRKHGFGLPFGVWLESHEGLRSLSQAALASLEMRRIVRPQFVASLWRHRLPEHPGYYGEMIWLLVMLELWLQARAPGFATR